ncbi:hypothetical protein TNIN_319601 [Trichonephila inaurata madagascariensis]|uniref:Uncharacterized protein n=1 Tax=Trichonephila inaurata madagascariensis TaxID=2747483 RepID=A0A8X6WMX8_9ARAC|nr:hypothetical protein TNIN_319601 [Trichonephila inaurata madagascariensis]
MREWPPHHYLMSRALPSFFCASSSFHPSDAIFFRGKQKRRDVSFLSEENRGALPPSIRKRSSGTGVSFSPSLSPGSRLLPFFLQWMEESGCVAGKEMGWNHFSLPPLR